MKILRTFKRPGANPKSLLALEKALNGRCPEFLDFCREMNGFEMELEADYASGDLLEELDCMRFDDADFIVEMLPTNEEYFPGVLVIGSDAATNRLALDLRMPGQAPLIVFRADEKPYLHTSKSIARSFAEFLQNDKVRAAIKRAEPIPGHNAAKSDTSP